MHRTYWWHILSIIVIAMVFGVSTAAAEPAGPSAAKAGTPVENKVSPQPPNAATVNGKAIPYADFETEITLLQRRMEQQGQILPEERMGEIRGQLLDEMINQELLYQESQKQGLKIDARKVEEEMDALKARYKDPQEFQQLLSEMHLTEKKIKEQMEQKMAIRAWLDKEIISSIDVSDEAAKSFYDQNPAYFAQPAQVHARHILIKVEEGATTETKQAARKKIEELKKRIDAGEDFSALAREHSECPSAANGGDLGYFAQGKMVKPFSDKAFSMKVNEVSDPVETNFGYHLIQILDRRESNTVTFDEAKEKIKQNLRNQGIQEKVQTHLAELRKVADIKTYLQ